MNAKKLIFLIVNLIILFGCVTTLPSEWSCKNVVPPNFKESDLVGTWQADYFGDRDTIIIRGDRTYKQILHSEDLSVDYESDWQGWWVEYGKDDIPYLYLENMMLCVYGGLSSCELGKGGSWFDYCTGYDINTSGEGIFVVIYQSSIESDQPSLHLGSLLYDPEVSGIRYERISP